MFTLDMLTETGLIDPELLRNELYQNALDTLRDHMVISIVSILSPEKHELSPIVMHRVIGISYETMMTLLRKSIFKSSLNDSVIIVYNYDVKDRVVQYEPSEKTMLEVCFNYGRLDKLSKLLNVKHHELMIGYIAEQVLQTEQKFIILLEKWNNSHRLEQHAPYTLSLSYILKKLLTHYESEFKEIIRKVVCR